MFIQVFREVIDLFKSRKKEGGSKVCPNGHVMQPSWDMCPYCQQMQEAMLRGGGGGGGGGNSSTPGQSPGNSPPACSAVSADRSVSRSADPTYRRPASVKNSRFSIADTIS